MDAAEIEAICRAQFDAVPPEPGDLSARIGAIMAVEGRLGVRFSSHEIDTIQTSERIAEVAWGKFTARG